MSDHVWRTSGGGQPRQSRVTPTPVACECIRLVWVIRKHDQVLVNVCVHTPQVVDSLQPDDDCRMRAWEARHEVWPLQEALAKGRLSNMPAGKLQQLHACLRSNSCRQTATAARMLEKQQHYMRALP